MQHGYVYAGGAHGVYGDTYFIFDMKDKKRITLNEVADLAALTPLAKAAYDDYNRTQDLYEARQGTDIELSEVRPFYFAPDGLVLVFNPYELGTYAEGIIELKIPYEKLSGVVDKKYLP